MYVCVCTYICIYTIPISLENCYWYVRTGLNSAFQCLLSVADFHTCFFLGWGRLSVSIPLGSYANCKSGCQIGVIIDNYVSVRFLNLISCCFYNFSLYMCTYTDIHMHAYTKEQVCTGICVSEFLCKGQITTWECWFSHCVSHRNWIYQTWQQTLLSTELSH